MTVKRPTYIVELDDESTHTVQVLMADQLRAELEAPRQGIPVDVSQAPVHTAALWVWSALLRTGVLPKGSKFQEARERMVAVSRVPEDQPAEPDQPVDPTQQGQGPGQP